MDLEKIIAAMKEIVDLAETENRAMTDDEVTRYEGLETDLKAAQKTAELRARQDAYETPIDGVPAVIHTDKGAEALNRSFDKYLRTGTVDADMAELRAQGTDSPGAGGYLVAPAFRNKLIEVKESFGGLASVAETITTSTGAELPWVTTVAADPDDVEITAEHAKFSTGADFEFGTATLGAYKYTSVGAGGEPLRVSVELLQDSAFNVNDFISRKLGERIHRRQAQDYMIGDGSGEPKGLFNTTGDVTGALTYANALNMVFAIDPAYRQNGKWLMGDAGVKALAGQVDNSGRPLWNSATDGLKGGIGGNFLGYPVIIDSGAPTMASGVVYAAFGDFREAYVIRNVKDVTVVVNPYSRANYGEVEYVAWARSDGTIQNRSAYATIKGS